ncbi:MAG: hypothetical protein AB1416_07890 [Actinomycetota bacterium]
MILGLLTRPFRLVGLVVTVALIVGGIWAWRRIHTSTPAAEDRALAAYRTQGSTGGAVRPGVPRPGVYSYELEGSERAGAGPVHVTRDLPRRAPMIVRLVPGGYETELRVSEEHLEGFRYRVTSRGTLAVSTRTKLTFLGLGRDDRRTLTPRPLHLPARPAVGAGWRDVYKAGSLLVRVQSRVLRAETVRVGGRSVPTVVVRIRSDTEGVHPGRRIETLWWSPDLALVVRRVDDLEIGGTFSFDETATMRLVSTTPRT